ncbi:hypothetical protein QQF64_000365 [Cirrhinus molitorella]|uniref:Uncharacterized protein n=1 Tax=Cirrhinus molitorella TaxID=172907 RepID=A0ABR3NXM7_9TELE
MFCSRFQPPNAALHIKGAQSTTDKERDEGKAEISREMCGDGQDVAKIAVAELEQVQVLLRRQSKMQQCFPELCMRVFCMRGVRSDETCKYQDNVSLLHIHQQVADVNH